MNYHFFHVKVPKNMVWKDYANFVNFLCNADNVAL